MGVAGVGFEKAAIVEVAGVKADKAAGTFNMHGYSGCCVGHQPAGIVNDGDLIDGDVAWNGQR